MKIFFLTLGAALYFIPLSIGLQAFQNAALNLPSAGSSDKQVSSVTSTYNGLVSQTENVSSSSNVTYSPKQPQSPSTGWIDVAVIEQIWCNAYKNYSKFALNLPIHLRKSDLIFPFHYFW